MVEFIGSVPGIVSLVGIVIIALRRFGRAHFISQKGATDKAVQIVISLIVLAAALYAILSQRYTPDVQKWAFGTVGLILGYWLPAQ